MINTIVKIILAPFRSLVMVIAPVSTCVVGISFAIPLWQSIFRLIMAAVWLPFIFYIVATSHLYQKAKILRPLLALISIPLLLLLDIFNGLMPGSHGTDKFDKASMIDSWPFSSWSSDSHKPSKALQHELVNSLLIREEIMPTDGKQYSFVGSAPLPEHRSPMNHKSGNTNLSNCQVTVYQVDRLSASGAKITTCTLCGDMVRQDWERCPRCDEPLEGLLRLPAIWYRKNSPVDQKMYQYSR